MHNLIYFTRNAGKVQGKNGKSGACGTCDGPQTADPSSASLPSALRRSLQQKRGCEEMRIHFFTAPFCFAFIWFRVQGSRFRVEVAASPPFILSCSLSWLESRVCHFERKREIFFPHGETVYAYERKREACFPTDLGCGVSCQGHSTENSESGESKDPSARFR